MSIMLHSARSPKFYNAAPFMGKKTITLPSQQHTCSLALPQRVHLSRVLQYCLLDFPISVFLYMGANRQQC